MKIIRVFPRKTSVTPADDMAFIGDPGLFKPEADEVHISVAFSWDKAEGERLKEAWGQYYPKVLIGGPAYGCKDDKFMPRRYVKKGITFSSRGCDFRCPWCLVPRMEGRFRELPEIAEGNIIQDNNILLSSERHFVKVIDMLRTQKAIRFNGGLDVRLLKDWHVDLLAGLSIKEFWLALDSWDKRDEFYDACLKLRRARFTRHQIRAYVLAGFNELIQDSEKRLKFVYECGALPFIQVYQPVSDEKRMAGESSRADNLFARAWSRPASIATMMKERVGRCTNSKV